MQTCDAGDYLGKRIKMTGYIKSENVTDWAGMWFRVDSKTEYEILSFDNMQDIVKKYLPPFFLVFKIYAIFS